MIFLKNYRKFLCGKLKCIDVNIIMFNFKTSLILLLLLVSYTNALAYYFNNANTNTPLSATGVYVVGELQAAGWDQATAEAVVKVNDQWFTMLKKHDQSRLNRQVGLLKSFYPSHSVRDFLIKHPEVAGLLISSSDPKLVVNMLGDSQECYNIFTNLYMIHLTVREAQLLTEALKKHRDILCDLAKRGFFGSETVFVFPRETRGAKEYDKWLRGVFDLVFLKHADADEEIAELIGFLIEKGATIRQRLNKDPDFYKYFRRNLWPKLMDVVKKQGAFELLANDPYIWDLLALEEGETILNKWGLGPVSLLFGDANYPKDMQFLIIQILLVGDDNTVNALFRYKDEPLFHDLLRRQLRLDVQAAAINQLDGLCQSHSQKVCPELSNRLQNWRRLTNRALVEEVGPAPSGAVTWIPFYGSYYSAKKWLQGRELDPGDMLNLGLDALIIIPITRLAKFGGGLVSTPSKEAIEKIIARKGIQQTAFKRGQKVIVSKASRPISYAILQNKRSIISQLAKSSKEVVTFKVTKPLQLLYQKTGTAINSFRRINKLDATIMLHNTKMVIAGAGRKLGDAIFDQIFEKTAETILEAAIAGTAVIVIIPQQQSAWWLLNAEMNHTVEY